MKLARDLLYAKELCAYIFRSRIILKEGTEVIFKKLVNFGQLCVALLLTTTGIAQAAPVTYYFGGRLSWVDSALSPTFAVGNGFSGSFTYESTAVDSSPDDPTQGPYAPGPAFAVTVNGLPFSIEGGGSGSVYVYDDYNGEVDRLTVGSGDSKTTGSSINGYFPFLFMLEISDYTQTAFNTDALPSSGLNLTQFSHSVFDLEFLTRLSGDSASIRGPLSYLSLTDPNASTSVPEPSSLALLGLGLAGLGASIIRRRPRISGGRSGLEAHHA